MCSHEHWAKIKKHQRKASTVDIEMEKKATQNKQRLFTQQKKKNFKKSINVFREIKEYAL